MRPSAALFAAVIATSFRSPSTSVAMAKTTGERSFGRVIGTQTQREGGGFLIRRSVGSRDQSVLDPFLMLDHMGPSNYGPGEAIGAPDHPHRGFETVSYMLQGEFRHKDSHGNQGSLGPGWVQWMTAGSGVIHSEMPSEKIMKEGGTIEGFQLWVNLPKKDKMMRPRYQDVPPERIPKVKTPDGLTQVSVIAGECLGASAVIDTRIPITMLDIHVKAGGKLTQPVPSDQNAFVYVYAGRGRLGDSEAKMGEWIVMENDGDQFTVSCPEDGKEMRAILLAGKPINEPVAKHGPFVMNTQEEIYEAFRDYQQGAFGIIPPETDSHDEL